MSKGMNDSQTDPRQPGLLHRFALGAITTVAFLQLLAIAFLTINLDPDLLTRQLNRASEAQVGAWTVIAGLTVFGLWRATRFVVGTFIDAWDGFRHWADPLLATFGAVWLCVAIWQQDIFTAGTSALLLAMLGAWRTEVVRREPKALS